MTDPTPAGWCLQMLDDNDEWVDVPGVTSIEFESVHDLALAAAIELDAERAAARRVVVQASMAQMIRAMGNAGTALAAFARAVQASGLADEDGKPVRTDRPAWQSPYGPPPRHRR